MSVQEIETAIDNLPEEEVRKLADWLAQKQSQLWDKQIEDDFNAGRLDALLDEADEEYERGLTKPL